MLREIIVVCTSTRRSQFVHNHTSFMRNKLFACQLHFFLFLFLLSCGTTVDAEQNIHGLQTSDKQNRPVLFPVRALHVPHLITEKKGDMTIAVTEEPDEIKPDSSTKAQDWITAADLLEEIEQDQDPVGPPTSDLNIVEVSSVQQEEDTTRDNMTNPHGSQLKGVTTSATVLLYVVPLVTIVAATALMVCIFTIRQRFVQFRPFRPFIAGVSLSDFSDTQVEPSSWRSPFSTRGFLPETWNQRKYQAQSLEREASSFRFDSLEERGPN